MRVAIIHEFVVRMGGAERVLSKLIELFPDADVYSLVYDERLTKNFYANTLFKGSYVQKLPSFLRRRYWMFANKFTAEVENWDLSEYDLVISSSNSFSHGVITNSNCLHVCYYHSPARYVWDWKNEYLLEKNIFGWKKILVDWITHKQRIWDFQASRRPDVRIANSKHVQKRISKYYKLDSQVIYPPVDIQRFKPSNDIENYYLIVSTLTPFKRIDLAIEACNELNYKLKIIGDGKDINRLRKLANKSENIEFMGFCSDEKVSEMMSKCKGFVFCGEEDFGITPVEVMASGRPVLAYKKGGLLETIIEGKTGLFFENSTVESLKKKWEEFDNWIDNDFQSQDCTRQALNFSEDIFKKKFLDVVKQEYEKQVKFYSN